MGSRPWLSALLLVLLTLVVAAICGVTVLYVRQVLPNRRLWAERDAIKAVIDGIAERPPESADPRQWQDVCGWLDTATGNICFSPNHAKLEDARRAKERIAAFAPEVDDYDDLVRIWEMLGEIQPYGPEYTSKFRVMLDDCLPEEEPDETGERPMAWSPDATPVRLPHTRVLAQPGMA